MRESSSSAEQQPHGRKGAARPPADDAVGQTNPGTDTRKGITLLQVTLTAWADPQAQPSLRCDGQSGVREDAESGRMRLPHGKEEKTRLGEGAEQTESRKAKAGQISCCLSATTQA